MIGRCIWTTGIFDLAVGEVLCRLIDPGACVVDAGANVGYMSVLAAAAAGPEGRVLAIEPHPELYRVLQQNVDAVDRPAAWISTIAVALGDRNDVADLYLPRSMRWNDGVASTIPRKGAETRQVLMRSLDSLLVLDDDEVALMKLDVEGAEAQVIRGAEALLGSGQIRHVVYEDHIGRDSEVSRVLESHGYTLFSIGWTSWGPRLIAADQANLTHSYEAPSYLASLDPSDALQRCRARGWRTLRANGIWQR